MHATCVNNACVRAELIGLGVRCSHALLSTARANMRAADGCGEVPCARVTCAMCHMPESTMHASSHDTSGRVIAATTRCCQPHGQPCARPVVAVSELGARDLRHVPHA